MAFSLSMLRKEGFLSKVIVLCDQGLFSLGNFIVSYLLATNLETEIFGKYSIFIAIFLFIQVIQGSIVSQPFQILWQKEKNEDLLTSTVILNCILLIILGVGVILMYFSGFFSVELLAGFYLFVFAGSSHELVRRILLGRFNFEKLLLVDIVFYLLRICLLGVLLKYDCLRYTELGFVFFILALSGGYSIFVMFKYVKFKKGFAYFIFQLLSLGRWIVLVSLVYWLSSQSYLFILRFFENNIVVGVYSSLILPFGVVRIITMATEAYLLPQAASVAGTNLTLKVINDLWKSSLMFVIPILILYLFFFSFPSQILKIFYGDKYIEYLVIFRILVINNLIVFVNSLIIIAFKATKQTKMIVKYIFGSFMISIPVVVGLIFYFGLEGLALGQLLNAVVCFVLFIGLILKTIKSTQKKQDYLCV